MNGLRLDPGEVPYGGWRHRRKFAAAMRRWLEPDQQRRLFRVRVDRVLEAKRKDASDRGFRAKIPVFTRCCSLHDIYMARPYVDKVSAPRRSLTHA